MEESSTVMRRLNRFEYVNTLRDLLGVNTEHFDPTADFPADATSICRTFISEAKPDFLRSATILASSVSGVSLILGSQWLHSVATQKSPLNLSRLFTVHLEGFEPSTSGFVVRCSIQLSYRCLMFFRAFVHWSTPYCTPAS